MTKGLRTGVLASVIAACLVAAPGAFASTVAESGNTVTWTAAGGIANNVTIGDSATDVTIVTTGDPVSYDNSGANNNITTDCVDDDATTADGTASVITCSTPPVTTVVLNAGDLNDTVDGSPVTSHTLAINLGDGNDTGWGGALNDTLSGGAGDDELYGYNGADAIDGGDGNDTLWGNDGSGNGPDGGDTLTGGAGEDDIHGQVGDDTIDAGSGDDFGSGGPGNDAITLGDGNDTGVGGPGSDTIDGGSGDDSLYGDGGSGTGGNDTLNGGDGNDYLEGDDGADVSSGGAGSDYFWEEVDDGADTISGGAGYDAVEYDVNLATVPADSVNASLDNQANDGFTASSGSSATSDNANNFGGDDVEQLILYPRNASVTATGNGAPNSIQIYPNTPTATNPVGTETVDAGAGPDFVKTGNSDDTINANDGSPDTIDCMGGNDTANVDQFDTTYNCETVNVAQRASVYDVPEDAPPTVSWVLPAPGKAIASTKATTLQVNASDDHGVSKVEFYVGQRLVCTATAAPYTCSYLPQGIDLGRNTLVAVAYDTAGQTGTSLNSVTVPRFVAKSLTAKTTPKKAKKFPATFTTSGKLILPSNVGNAVGCFGGHVSIQFRAGKKTISNRRVATTKSCTYKSKVKFRLPGRLRPKSLTVLVRFLGSQVVGPRSHKAYKVKVTL